MVATLRSDMHFSLCIRAAAGLGMYASCVDTAAHRHLTSPARLGTAGFLIVRTGEVDNGPSRDISLTGT